MRLALIILLSFSTLHSAFACSLQMTTETLFGASVGSVCANISEVVTDRRGSYRLLEYEVTDRNDEMEEFSPIKLRERMTRPLRKVEVIGLGFVNLMTIKVNSMSSVTVKFLNGNSINVSIDESGRTSPEKICVRQIGLTQLRGFANHCP